ncbi:hypothetical protein C475_18551 [Halosimplex carlsbadense 2-9-1]|uniref:STAS/SEC14 domain-containing protein n=1 Tax=Halosimplex carlsbadense 2-9-1 TaxID=797114 RepID=M0CEU1_9EURY|nr:hypothetical protein [Halosimplex carlsbadense]ELZ21775.1 hypothetical protein C475_18551 [Halosimplex carlsbadense 2-9-1]
MSKAPDSIPDPADYEWEFEQVDDVGIWFMEGWRGFADEDLEAASTHYRERGGRGDIDATIAVFGDDTNLGKETQEYMGREWSANGKHTDVDRIGFVSEGTTAMAVAANVDVSGAEVDTFGDLDAAVEWAQS